MKAANQSLLTSKKACVFPRSEACPCILKTPVTEGTSKAHTPFWVFQQAESRLSAMAIFPAACLPTYSVLRRLRNQPNFNKQNIPSRHSPQSILRDSPPNTHASIFYPPYTDMKISISVRLY